MLMLEKYNLCVAERYTNDYREKAFEGSPFTIMAFPVGPVCNLQCKYCYYLEKASLYPETSDFRMKEETLEEFIRQYIEAQPGPVVQFAWQGGEPTLRGLDFYEKAVELQKKYLPRGWQCRNAFQTNGILLNDEWCEFFKENDFLVGLSLDGPAWIHDIYRKDKKSNPTHEGVLRGLHLLQKHSVEYNVLCVVHKANVEHPLEVYRFFKAEGVAFIQFIPLVEHIGGGKVSPRSVSGEEYGRFLIEIFDEWVLKDIGDIFIQIFEETIGAWAGYRASLCIFSEICGRAPVMEHNGDLYSCDHFVYPEYKLGNIREDSIKNLVNSPQQKRFGFSKKDTLPKVCRKCNVRFICNGGCFKNRIIETEEKGKKLNYLCVGYKRFFGYVAPYAQKLVAVIKAGRFAGDIRKSMQSLHDSIWNVGHNDPCPCGSGRKYKKCCLPRKTGSARLSS